jgi:hypothetical protein
VRISGPFGEMINLSPRRAWRFTVPGLILLVAGCNDAGASPNRPQPTAGTFTCTVASITDGIPNLSRRQKTSPLGLSNFPITRLLCENYVGGRG